MRKFLIGVLVVLMLAITAYSASAFSLSTSSLDFDGDYGDNVTRTVTVTNSGSSAVTVTFSESGLSEFDFNYAPSTVNIAANSSKAVAISLVLPEENPVVHEGTITVSDGTSSKDIDVEVDLTGAETLVIASVEVEGDEIDNGDTFDEMQPMEEIKFEISIENNENDEDDSIEDITVTITIKDIDDAGEDDIEIESESVDLDGDGDDATVDLSFVVPYDIEDGKDYEVTIEVEGEGDGDDNDGDDYNVEWTIYLKGEKEKNFITITDTQVSPDEVTCGVGLVEFEVTAANTGSNDQDEVVLKLVSTALGIDKEFPEFDLDSDPDKSNFEETKTFTWSVPSTVKPGTYTVEAQLYFDEDKLSDRESMTVTVLSCGTDDSTADDSSSSASSGSTSTGTASSGSTAIQPGISYSEEKSIRDSPMYLVMMLVVIAAALVLIVFLILKMTGVL